MLKASGAVIHASFAGVNQIRFKGISQQARSKPSRTPGELMRNFILDSPVVNQIFNVNEQVLEGLSDLQMELAF